MLLTDSDQVLTQSISIEYVDTRKMKAEKQGYFTLEVGRGAGVVRVVHSFRVPLTLESVQYATSIRVSGVNALGSTAHPIEEWRRGLKALRADTISKLKKAFPELEKEVRRTSNFADFYTYSFRYCLTEEKQKTIDIESICQLLDLVLGFQFRAQVDYFIEYIKIQSDYKVINMDQWSGFYRFCNEISFPDFSNYDPELAWPLILDNFVEWMRAKQT